MKKIFLLIVSHFVIISCVSTTDTGVSGNERKQLMLVSSEEIEQMSAQGYEQLKAEAQKKGTLNQNRGMLLRLQSISQKLIPHITVFRQDATQWKWEVNLITSDELNAFCMPGGKIMFYTGIIQKLNLTDGEIAAIMGHEMVHALREHGRERMSQQIIQDLGIQTLVGTGLLSEKYAGAAAAVTNVTFTMRHGRGQEIEADEMGVELMARAGFNPEEAVQLWIKMGKAGGQKPPEFLSTHPSDETRVKRIQALLPRVMPLYR